MDAMTMEPLPNERLDREIRFWRGQLAELQREYERAAAPIIEAMMKAERQRSGYIISNPPPGLNVPEKREEML